MMRKPRETSTKEEEKRKEKREQKEKEKEGKERGRLGEWIDHEELDNDRMHLDETVPVTEEQRREIEVATAEPRELDVMQMEASSDPKI